MKNREKYKDKIFEIACTGRKVAVSKKGRPVACVDCDLCMYTFDKDCTDTFLEWCEAEYIERPTLTNNERKFLKVIDPKFKYMVRDCDGCMSFYINKPSKNTTCKCWNRGNDPYISIFLDFGLFNNVNFDMVQWENEEPWLIEDLKKLEVKEDAND